MSASRASRRVRPWAALGAIALFLGLGEAAARLTGFVDRVNPMPRRLYVATDVPDLPYRLRPGVALEVQGSRVSVNELGLRDRANLPPRPEPGTRRVLVLGDSVAFGWLQDADRAFPRRLEDDLRRMGGPWARTEVLNAGVPGYSATTEAAWFRDFGAALQPAVIVVAVNLNDFDRVPHMNGLGILSTDDDRSPSWSPSNWSELWLALRWGWLLARGDARIARPTAAQATPAPRPTDAAGAPERWDPLDRWVSGLRKRFYHRPTEPQWGDLARAWTDVVERGRGIGARVVFAIFPDGDQVGVDRPDLVPQEKLLGLCHERGFECVDLTPAFLAAGPGVDLHKDIMHPNDEGHAIAARVVADHLAGSSPTAPPDAGGASPG